MRFEIFLALRYLRAKRKQTMVSVISAISVLGIAAGVMALIIALALSTGFKEDIQAKILGTTSAINLMRIDGSPLEGFDRLLEAIGPLPRVTGSAPAIFGTNPALLVCGNENQRAMIKGVLPSREKEISDFFSHIVSGDPDALDAVDAQDGEKIVGHVFGGNTDNIVVQLPPGFVGVVGLPEPPRLLSASSVLVR